MTIKSWDIRWRWRADPMSISGPHHFSRRFREEVDEDVLIGNPHVSLYCLDTQKDEAVFVETPSDIDARSYPFFYQGQFRHATRLFTVGFEQFHEMAEQISDRVRCAVMVHSVGRCGSTLLSRLFDRSPNCVSLSEPDVPTQVTVSDYSEEDKKKLLRSMTAFYFNPREGQAATHLVMKFRSFCVEMAEQMYESFQPQVPIFLYRGIENVVTSGMRVFRYFGAPLWTIDVGHRLRVTRPLLSWLLKLNMPIGRKLFPFIDRFTTAELAKLGPVAILTIAWVSAVQKYCELFEKGMPFFALRYEELMSNPPEIVQQLLERCHLPVEQADQLLKVMDRDSQEGSVVSRSGRKDWTLTDRDRDVIREVLDRHEFISDVDYELPGTLAVT